MSQYILTLRDWMKLLIIDNTSKLEIIKKGKELGFKKGKIKAEYARLIKEECKKVSK